MLRYEIIVVTPFMQNCSLLWCDQTHLAAIIDPGGDSEKIIRRIEQLGVKPSQILLTHGHIDHVGAAKTLATHFQRDILGPAKADHFLFEALPEQSKLFDFSMVDAFEPDAWLVQDTMITVGDEQLKVLFLPGHTPGHIAFAHLASQRVWVGDVLFCGSIGRTDFPKGNFQQLMDSIKQRLFLLGDDFEFIPGHGSCGQLGVERKTNPYLT